MALKMHLVATSFSHLYASASIIGWTEGHVPNFLK